jgi:hypothetical protein
MDAVWQWISDNKEWLFSGVGVYAVIELGRFGRRRWRESQTAVIGQEEQPSHAKVPGSPLRSRLPGFLLRLRYKPDDLERLVIIGLRDNAPGSVNLGNPIPSVDLYFQVTNLSPIDLVLDRALVDVWFGQPTFTAALLHRYSVPAGQITQGIHVRYMLADNQKSYIQAFDTAEPRGSRGRFYIYITAYFESKLGRFMVQKAIERDRL